MLFANEGRPYIFTNMKPTHIRVEWKFPKRIVNDYLNFSSMELRSNFSNSCILFVSCRNFVIWNTSWTKNKRHPTLTEMYSNIRNYFEQKMLKLNFVVQKLHFSLTTRQHWTAAMALISSKNGATGKLTKYFLTLKDHNIRQSLDEKEDGLPGNCRQNQNCWNASGQCCGERNSFKCQISKLPGERL